MSQINVDNLSVRYGANTVLRQVGLTLEPGETVTIVGPSGSGKTSLLRAINGATEPVAERIALEPGLRIGHVPQRLHIDPALPVTVERFMRLGDRVRRQDCTTALDVAGVPGLLKQQMSQLSGGEFQRVLLARALINRPEILLPDEATQGLDQPRAARRHQRIISGGLSQRPRLLRRHVDVRGLRPGVPGAVRDRHQRGVAPHDAARMWRVVHRHVFVFAVTVEAVHFDCRADLEPERQAPVVPNTRTAQCTFSGPSTRAAGTRAASLMPSGPWLRSSAARMSLSFATCAGATRRAVFPSYGAFGPRCRNDANITQPYPVNCQVTIYGPYSPDAANLTGENDVISTA